MITCGWCHRPTREGRCSACGYPDAGRPWRQRGIEPPEVPDPSAGRPTATIDDVRRRLEALGPDATDEDLAAHHEVDPRTVRRWRRKVSA